MRWTGRAAAGALGLAFALTLGAHSSLADGAWLTPPYTSWNTPGMSIPLAGPATSDDTEFSSTPCLPRTPETAEDKAVSGAGWTLFDAYISGWGMTVIDGERGYDGMCRPLDWQSFVFVNGVFAGTLSPVDMEARTTGDLLGVRVLPGGTSIVAQYAKYVGSDPFCCPSQDMSITYDVNSQGGLPVVTPYNPP